MRDSKGARRMLIGAALAVLVLVIIGLVDTRSKQQSEHADTARASAARTGEQLRARLFRGPQRRPLEDQGPQSARRGRIRGVARGRDGQPLAGAVACAWCALCNIGFVDNAQRCVRANRHGEFDLSDLPTGEYRIAVSAEGRGIGLANDGKVVEVGPDGTVNETNGDAELGEQGATVAGVVRDALGGSIAGAEVRVATLSAPEAPNVSVGVSVQADAEGRFQIDVPPGWVRLVALSEGYAPADVSRVAPAHAVELVLSPASTINGYVIEGKSSEPVAGATVRARGMWGPAQAATSNAEGAFHLNGLKPGTYTLRAFADGFIGQYGDSVSLELSQNVSDVLIRMGRAVRVEGTLLADGEPCHQGIIDLGPTGPEDDTVPREVMDADPEGRVAFPALPPGRYSVQITCPGYGSQIGPPLELGGEDRLDLVWQVQARAQLDVRAVDVRGEPVAQLYMSLGPVGEELGDRPQPSRFRSGQTDGEGRLTIRGMQAGRYALKSPFLAEPVFVEMEVNQIRQLEIQASTLGEMLVHVTTPGGVPLQDVTVAADRSDGPPAGFGRSAGGGSFRIGPVEAGTYRVSVRDAVNPRSVHPEPVEVEPGKVSEVSLVYGGYAGEIAGRVLAGPDQPLADVWVSAVSVDQRQDRYAAAQQFTARREGTRRFTDPDGRFILTGLDPKGSYLVLAERPSGGEAALENVTTGQSVELIVAGP